jgi:single-strand DNA-binding protein
MVDGTDSPDVTQRPSEETSVSENNLVVLRGTLVADPRLRELPSGSVLSQFDVTTRDDTGTQSVPVAWFEPPPSGVPAVAGDDVVVIGSVRRRFFRVGGATQSRTEVIAEQVIPARRSRQVGRSLGAVRALLGEG